MIKKLGHPQLRENTGDTSNRAEEKRLVDSLQHEDSEVISNGKKEEKCYVPRYLKPQSLSVHTRTRADKGMRTAWFPGTG